MSDKKEIAEWFSADRAERWERLYTDARLPEDDSFKLRRDYAVDLVRTRVPKAGRVLDLGCGTGAALVELAKLGPQVAGLDYAPDMLRHARERCLDHGLDPGVLLRGDASDTPFEDGTFDCVICLGVISYQEDYSPILREIRRLLTAEGVALITFRNLFHPLASDPWSGLKAIGRFVVRRQRPTSVGIGRHLDPSLVQKDIEAAGLRCETFEGIGLGPFHLAGRRLFGDETSIRLSHRLTSVLRGLGLRWTLRWSADVAMFVCRPAGR